MVASRTSSAATSWTVSGLLPSQTTPRYVILNPLRFARARSAQPCLSPEQSPVYCSVRRRQGMWSLTHLGLLELDPPSPVSLLNSVRPVRRRQCVWSLTLLGLLGLDPPSTPPPPFSLSLYIYIFIYLCLFVRLCLVCPSSFSFLRSLLNRLIECRGVRKSLQKRGPNHSVSNENRITVVLKRES